MLGRRSRSSFARIIQVVHSLVLRIAACYAVLFVVYAGAPIESMLLHQSVQADRRQSTPILHVVVPWIGQRVLHLEKPITVFTNASGDTTYDWLLLSLFGVISGIGGTIWLAIDRHGDRNGSIDIWLRFGLRTFLAFELLWYGFDKLIPVQFGVRSEVVLQMPLRALAPMGILWTTMASSPGYTEFSGVVESAAGVLLLLPKFSKVGALIGLAALTNVFALNCFFDVPVKLLSFHLLAIALYLSWPHLCRLVDVLISNKPVSAAPIASFIDVRSVGPIVYAIWVLAIYLAFASLSTNLATRASYVKNARVDPEGDRIHWMSEYPRFFSRNDVRDARSNARP